MMERPEYKRRWAPKGWDALQEKALRAWLLDRIEDRSYWFDENGQPAIVTLARLADALSVTRTSSPSPRSSTPPGPSGEAVVAELLADEHVPFLAASALQAVRV